MGRDESELNEEEYSRRIDMNVGESESPGCSDGKRSNNAVEPAEIDIFYENNRRKVSSFMSECQFDKREYAQKGDQRWL
jgi:hypothetical protein